MGARDTKDTLKTNENTFQEMAIPLVTSQKGNYNATVERVWKRIAIVMSTPFNNVVIAADS